LSRAEKNSVILDRKNPAHDHPTVRVRTQFSGWARVGPGLGRSARAFYSVKQLKTAFLAGLGPKENFVGFKISAHARPVRFVGGLGAGRAQNAQEYSRCPPVPPSASASKFFSILPSSSRLRKQPAEKKTATPPAKTTVSSLYSGILFYTALPAGKKVSSLLPPHWRPLLHYATAPLARIDNAAAT
jgi:hypothetical protein